MGYPRQGGGKGAIGPLTSRTRISTSTSFAAAVTELSGAPEGVSLGLVLTLAREHLGVDAVFLAHFEDGVEVFVLGEGDIEGFGPIVEGARLPLDETYCDRVLRDHLPSVIADTAADSTVQALAITHQAGIGSYIGIPVRLPDDTLFGMFCCVSHRPNRSLSETDRSLMTLLARLVGREIERRKVSTAVIAAEHRVGRLLAEWGTVDSLLAGVLACLAPIAGSDTGAAWLTGAEGAVVERRIAAGSTARDGDFARPGEAAENALTTGLPVRTATELAVPLGHDDHMLGVLEWRGEVLLTLDRHTQYRLGRIGADVGTALASAALPAGRPYPTARELEVLQLVADGRGAREIAVDLNISPATVRTHLRNIYGKLEVSDRAAAVAEGLRHRLIV